MDTHVTMRSRKGFAWVAPVALVVMLAVWLLSGESGAKFLDKEDVPVADDAATGDAEVDDFDGQSADHRPAMLSPNEWHVLTPEEARELLPFAVLLADEVPDGFRGTPHIAVMPFDVTGNDQANVHRVSVTYEGPGTATDKAGHGRAHIEVGGATLDMAQLVEFVEALR